MEKYLEEVSLGSDTEEEIIKDKEDKSASLTEEIATTLALLVRNNFKKIQFKVSRQNYLACSPDMMNIIINEIRTVLNEIKLLPIECSILEDNVDKICELMAGKVLMERFVNPVTSTGIKLSGLTEYYYNQLSFNFVEILGYGFARWILGKKYDAIYNRWLIDQETFLRNAGSSLILPDPAKEALEEPISASHDCFSIKADTEEKRKKQVILELCKAMLQVASTEQINQFSKEIYASDSVLKLRRTRHNLLHNLLSFWAKQPKETGSYQVLQDYIDDLKNKRNDSDKNEKTDTPLSLDLPSSS